MAARLAAPRTAVIEGRPTLIIERRPPLPARLSDLLAKLRLMPIRITGWRSACAQQDHRLVLIGHGSYLCTDGVRRDLRVEMCQDCESACVRDVSVDHVNSLAPRFLRPRRRNAVMGWYSGARQHQRTYASL